MVRVSSWASSGVACRVWPSCQRNSLVRRKGRVVFSQRMTEHHWLYLMGRSRQVCTHFEYMVQKIVSLVGRTARRSWSFSVPPWVTQATSGAKPSTCSASLSRRLSGISMGKYTFS